MSLSVNYLQQVTSRLVEYFCVVGLGADISFARDPTTGSIEQEAEFETLEKTFNVEILDRYPLHDRVEDGIEFPDGISLFCHPGGLKLSLGEKLPTFFTFVQTGMDGARMYGYVCTLYEPLRISQIKAIELLLGRSLESPESEKGQTYYAPKSLCLLSVWPFFNEFRQWFQHLYAISLAATSIPIERYICNFLEEVPCPPAGEVEVRYSIGPNLDILFHCPPCNNPTAWSSFPFRILFECLDVQNILSFFTAVLLERQVLVLSSYLFPLTACTEVIMLLLYPLERPHVYIPLCPKSLLGVMNAPCPWVVGTKREYLLPDAEIPQDVIRVDLDENHIDMGTSGALPPLPPRRYEKLVAALETFNHVFESRGEGWKTNTLPRCEDIFHQASRPTDGDYDTEKRKEETVSRTNWQALRESFLRFFVSIFKDYHRFIPEGASQTSQGAFFQHESFLSKQPSDWRPFLSELLQTQTFAQFINSRLEQDNEDLDFKFFEESIQAKKNRSRFQFRKAETTFLKAPSTFDRPRSVIPETPDTSNLENSFLQSLEEAGGWKLMAGSRPRSNSTRDVWQRCSIRTAQGVETSHLSIYYGQKWPRLLPELYTPPRPMPEISEGGQGRKTTLKKKHNTLFVNDATQPATGADAIYGLWLLIFTHTIAKPFKQSNTLQYNQDLSDDSEDEVVAVEDDDYMPGNSPISTSRKSRAPATGPALESNGVRSRIATLRSPSPSRIRRRQSSDIRDELRQQGSSALEIILDVLKTLRSRGIKVEFSVFRALFTAALRVGDTGKAVQIINESEKAGYRLDAAIKTSMAISLAHSTNKKDAENFSKNSFILLQTRPTENSTATNSSPFLTRKFSSKSIMSTSDAGPTSPRGSANASMMNNLRRRFERRSGTHTDPTVGRTQLSGIIGIVVGEKEFSILIQQQTQLGESLLSSLYPDLEIDTDRESCPSCNKALTQNDLKYGWKADTNVYTTTCPFCNAEATALEMSTGRPSHPLKEFVPRFSVKCSDSKWEGTTGKGSPLFCEYLSPWVLRKEIQNIVLSDGAEILLSPDFSKKNQTCATIFWNLIVHFREHNLPLTFLFVEAFPGAHSLFVSPMMEG